MDPFRGECGHAICRGCLALLHRADCPLCRAPLVEPATLQEIAEGRSYSYRVPAHYEDGHSLPLPLPTTTTSNGGGLCGGSSVASHQSMPTAATIGGNVESAEVGCGVNVEPPRGTRPGMTLCVVWRLQRDVALAEAVAQHHNMMMRHEQHGHQNYAS